MTITHRFEAQSILLAENFDAFLPDALRAPKIGPRESLRSFRPLEAHKNAYVKQV